MRGRRREDRRRNEGGRREGRRAVTCGVGMEQCSPQGMMVSPAPLFSPHPPHPPTLPNSLTSSPFSPPPLLFDTAAGGGRGEWENGIGAQRGGESDGKDRSGWKR